MTKLLEFERFDGKATGVFGIINGIKWLGIVEWLKVSWRWRQLVAERDIWNWKTGH